MLGYRVPKPNQAMLVSARRSAKGADGKPAGAAYQVSIGHGRWVFPMFRKVEFLGLDLHKVEIDETCRSTEGIQLHIMAVVAFKVQSDADSVNAAAQRFLGEQKVGQMEEMTRRTYAGHLRSIVGELPALDILRKRDTFVEKVMTHSQMEMSKFGVTVDSLQIEHLDDLDQGYFDNVAAKTLADQQKEADIARAVAAQTTAEAVQDSTRKQNEQVRDTALKAAENKSAVDKANADAEAAGQLAKADVEQRVLEKQQSVADTNAELIKRQLVGERIMPAEAEAKAKRIVADADTSVAEAAAIRAGHEADAQKTRQVHAAEAQAESARLTAEASRDAAKFDAEAVRARGEADAAAALAKGQADAQATEAMGLAEAAGERAKADAISANDDAQLRLAEINQRAALVRAAAEGLGLSKANLTILDGPEGLTKVITALGPVVSMFGEMFRNPTPPPPVSNGNGTAKPAELAEWGVAPQA